MSHLFSLLYWSLLNQANYERKAKGKVGIFLLIYCIHRTILLYMPVNKRRVLFWWKCSFYDTNRPLTSDCHLHSYRDATKNWWFQSSFVHTSATLYLYRDVYQPWMGHLRRTLFVWILSLCGFFISGAYPPRHRGFPRAAYHFFALGAFSYKNIQRLETGKASWDF